MISLTVSSIKNDSLKDIKKSNSILIIGKAATSYKAEDIFKPSSLEQAETLYGKSDLYQAYKIAASYGATNVFLMNCAYDEDFIECLPTISHYNFSYVIPVGINISDTFYDGITNSKLYYAYCYLKDFSANCHSTIIFTDKHASFYEDINQYLFDMHNIIDDFVDATEYELLIDGRNLLFVLNSLEDIDFANVLLGAVLAETKISNYPEPVNVKSVFDFNDTDIYRPEIIYFKNNINIYDTVENLNNFRTEQDAVKLVTINNVIKFIENNLDFENVIGKPYNQYIQLKIKDEIDSFFNKECKAYVKDYAIQNIEFVKTSGGTGYVLIQLIIYPINSIENIQIDLKIV